MHDQRRHAEIGRTTHDDEVIRDQVTDSPVFEEGRRGWTRTPEGRTASAVLAYILDHHVQAVRHRS